uniref:Terpene synthase metal-binding domain-containing protein n=1 Tax=Salix viminalis TaxID=40686 RepID=A0A6N2LEK1_SALVM
MESKQQVQVAENVLHCQNNSQDLYMIQERRSANYKPNIWKHDFLQSLSSKHDEEQYRGVAAKLREEVQKSFGEALDLLATMKLVDSIVKLGLESYFEEEIKQSLDIIAASIKNRNLEVEENLYATALRSKSTDVRGLIELFEASHLAYEGEATLDEAKAFSTRILTSIDSRNIETDLAKHVVHVLELPSHWRVLWFDVKWNINAYENDKHTNKHLLALAKVNFNMVQATLQKDLRDSSRWWRNLGLIENLGFTRDRLVESFLCAVGLVFEPKYSSFRKWLTKVIIMILIIDDVYDVYGSLNELQQFTEAVDRWDTREVQELPECMKICFQALFDITNEMALEMQGEKDGNQVLPHLKKVWGDFCKAMFKEAEWFDKGYTPSLQEYLSNAWVSSSGTVLSTHSFFSVMTELETEETSNFPEKNQDLVHSISLIIRLCNDLGTYVAEQERGDAASSVMCYMREVNVSEQVSRNHINNIIQKTWKKINGQCFTKSPTLRLFVNISTNMARVVHYLYQHGDGFGVQDRHENKKQILALLVEPFKLDLSEISY